MVSNTLQSIFDNDPHGLLDVNAYRIEYADGSIEVVVAGSAKEVVQKYDLATKEHIKTKIIQLEGSDKQKALDSWKKQF